jgi:hypothetical protein
MALVSFDKNDQKEVAAASVAAKNAGFAIDTAATVSAIGSVLKMPTIAASTIGTDATTVSTQFNALILALRAAGMMV